MPTKAEYSYVQKLYETAKKKRLQHEPEMQDAYLHSYPPRRFRIDPVAEVDQVPDRSKQFDSTATKTVDNLVIRVVQMLIPQTAKFVEIRVRNPQLADSLADRIKAANQFLFEFFADDSNFYPQTTSALYDAVVPGTFCVQVINDGPGTLPDFLAVPIDEIYFLMDHRSRIRAVFRKHPIAGHDMLELFPDADAQQVRNWTNNPGEACAVVERIVRQGPHKWLHWICLEENFEKPLKVGEMRRNPFVIARWSSPVGMNGWGIGPVRKALAEIKGANIMRKSLIRMTEYAAYGLFQVVGFDVTVPDKIAPNMILSTEAEIQPIKFAGDISVALNMLQDSRQTVRDFMMDAARPPADKLPYAKAEMFSYLKDQFFAEIGEAALLLTREFLQVIAEQTVEILIENGDLVILDPNQQARLLRKVGPDEVMKLLKISTNGAVKRLVRYQESSAKLMGVARVGQVLGPQQVALHTKTDELTREFLLGQGLEAGDLRALDEVAQIKKAQEQQQGALAIQSLVTAATQRFQPTGQDGEEFQQAA